MTEKPDSMTESIIYNFQAPIIVYPGMESDYKTDRWREMIIERRLVENIKNGNRNRASNLEVFIYLMSSTLAFPPSHTAYMAIAYLSRIEFPETAKVTEMPEVDIGKEPDVAHLIDGLATEIYKSQMAHIRAMQRKH